MSVERGEFLRPDEYQKYFGGSDVAAVWDRCMAVWRQEGRVQDYPHHLRMPKYSPSLGKRLGQQFAEEFQSRYSFVIEKMRSGDPTLALCAYDLLELIAWEFYDPEKLPKEMTEIDVPIPEPVRETFEFVWYLADFSGSTVGEFLPFLLENG